LLLAALVLTASAEGATRYDPALRFRSLTTRHFVIHFHQGEETMARRLAVVAEEVHAELTVRMGGVPRGRTHVILVDQTDEPNGWATPVPYDLIEISAVPPTGVSTIGNVTDWLRLVFTHEYAHVLHLGRSLGWARVPRRIFGRVPFAFPNLSLPLWQIEGLATFEESVAGEGRVHAEDFHAIVTEAARAGRFEPLDRLSGGLVDWPDGDGWYAYGAFFHAYLAERFGPATLRELSDRTAGRVPYVTAGAFEKVFGRSLQDLWRDFRSAQEPTSSGTPYPVVERLTFHGHSVMGPRFETDTAIVYSRRDPHGLPMLTRWSRAGGSTPLTSRIGGEHVAVDGEAIYFDQLELTNNVSPIGDVYRYDRRSGDVVRLTHGFRVADPDLSPDRKSIAVVAIRNGERDLVILQLDRLERHVEHHRDTSIETCPSEGPACRLAAGDGRTRVVARPRWSPDGRFIAAEARRAHSESHIVIVDVRTGGYQPIVVSPGRNVTPAWTPDGRSIVFASDRSGPFDLYRVHVTPGGGSTGRIDRLTRLPGGAHSPDVSRDGRHIVFVGYTPEGYDLFTMSLEAPGEADTSTETISDAYGGRDFDLRGLDAVATTSDTTDRSREYNPWSSLRPYSWLPVIETDDDQIHVGAATGGMDALGYHGWSAVATWPVARRDELTRVSRARPNVLVAYVYDRWRPTLFAQVEDETTGFLAGQAESGGRRAVSIRDRSVSLGVMLPFRRVRWSHSLLASWHLEHRTFDNATDGDTQRRGSLRGGWGILTAKRFGYSISPESGVAAGAAAEVSRRALGSDADTTFVRVDVRAFLPALPRHGVIALRGSGASVHGDPDARRFLRLGGADGDGGPVSFDEDATSLLRGFPANAFSGSTLGLVNAEYRLPLGWPQRGAGPWPLFLKSMHATLFADAGHAWNERFRLADVKTSWGTELSGDFTVFHAVPWTATVGVGWGRDGASGLRNREVYVRVGHGF
jgi:Tol biopolymer transport system component